MTALFGIQGENLDRGYVNLAEGRYESERTIRAAHESMWERYEPFADPNFRQGFARDPVPL